MRCPQSEGARYLDNLKKGRGWYRDTKKGTFYTAEMLFANRGNAERQVAVLILASLDVKMKEMSEKWRSNTYRLMEDMRRTIMQEFPDIILWHHASRDALPVTVRYYFPACNFIHLENETDALPLFFGSELGLELGQLAVNKLCSR